MTSHKILNYLQIWDLYWVNLLTVRGRQSSVAWWGRKQMCGGSGVLGGLLLPLSDWLGCCGGRLPARAEPEETKTDK